MSTHDKLNERPIYLRGVFLLLAIAQSVIHLHNDFSALRIPVSPLPAPSDPDEGTHPIAPVSRQLPPALLSILRRIIITSAMTCTIGPFVYTFCMRQMFWSWHLAFAKLYYNLARSDARPPGWAPANPLMMLRSFGAGLLLLLTWEATSFLFTALFVQEPLKKGQVLSAASKDPNGTLLNGVKAKTAVVKTFAFWELALIARSFPERRKAIFADIEREVTPAKSSAQQTAPGVEGSTKDGSMPKIVQPVSSTCWAQMQNAALDVIRDISIRIEGPKETATTATEQASPTGHGLNDESLPNIVRSVSSKAIFANAAAPRTRAEKFQAHSGQIAKTLGQSSQPWSPDVAKVKGLLEYVTPAGLSHEPAQTSIQQYWIVVQATPVGRVFRKSKRQEISAVVLGSGHAKTALIVDSIDIVTRMLVASLSEDVYGKAVSGVPEAVRTFVKAISCIENYVRKTGTVQADGIREVEIVVERLRAGLVELLSAFQLYLADVGLGIGELNEAKRAAEKRSLYASDVQSAPEMAMTTGAQDPTRNLASKSKAEPARQKANREQSGLGRTRNEERHEKPATRRIESGRGIQDPNYPGSDWNDYWGTHDGNKLFERPRKEEAYPKAKSRGVPQTAA